MRTLLFLFALLLCAAPLAAQNEFRPKELMELDTLRQKLVQARTMARGTATLANNAVVALDSVMASRARQPFHVHFPPDSAAGWAWIETLYRQEDGQVIVRRDSLWIGPATP